MNRYRHAHPIDIFLSTARFLGLLIFPLLRAAYSLLFTMDRLYDWLAGAWFDILTVLLIIGLGMLRWYRMTYRLEPHGIRVRQGIFLSRERYIPYKRLSVTSAEAPWYLIPIHAVHLSADTDGGFAREADFSMTVQRKEFLPFLKQCRTPFWSNEEIRRVYLPSNLNIAVLSFIASNSLTGVLFSATFLSGIGKVLGKSFERELMTQITTIMQLLAFGIPPAAAILAFTILGGWLISFLRNLVRHLRFSAVRQGASLEIRSGLFTRRIFDITVERINLVETQQNLLTKTLGLYSTFIHANGYGKKKDELSVLMPSCDKAELRGNLVLLLPEFPLCKPKLKPRLRYLSRFLIPPLVLITAVSILWMGAWRLFPSIHSIILYLGIMALIPCVWFLLVKIVSFFHTGIGVKEHVFTLRYSYGYRFKTVIVPTERIVRVDVRQSVFQLASGCCDLVFYTFSEGHKRHIVPNISCKEAAQLLGEQNLPLPVLLRMKKERR